MHVLFSQHAFKKRTVLMSQIHTTAKSCVSPWNMKLPKAFSIYTVIHQNPSWDGILHKQALARYSLNQRKGTHGPLDRRQAIYSKVERHNWMNFAGATRQLMTQRYISFTCGSKKGSSESEVRVIPEVNSVFFFFFCLIESEPGSFFFLQMESEPGSKHLSWVKIGIIDCVGVHQSVGVKHGVWTGVKVTGVVVVVIIFLPTGVGTRVSSQNVLQESKSDLRLAGTPIFDVDAWSLP